MPSSPRLTRVLALCLAAGIAACGGDPNELDLDWSAQPVAVPAKGTSTSLDVANWNIEWFGSTSNGPTNETLQLNNVRDVILGTDFDVWALEEVVSNTSFNSLKSQLPGYDGFVSNDAFVTSGSSWYSSTEQKLAILYRTSVATPVSAGIILTANNTDFAGRPPLEVQLDVTLNGATERRVFIILHMKAFNDDASWQRRQNAANALKSYLDSTYPTQKVFVLGDWNDDVDTSITPQKPTPFAQFVNDPARYTFETKVLTEAGISTTVSYTDTIDHQLVTNEQHAELVAGSVEAYRDLANIIPSYDATTTDHFPVLSRYEGGVAPPPPQPAITVTSPNGGESWGMGTTQNITWTSSAINAVKLEYSTDNGATWTIIASSASASSGSYAWTVPSTATTTARVRATDALNGTPSDTSDAAFTIGSATPARVIINEILANEPGSSTAGEAVELVNTGGTAASIGGWTISDGSGVKHTFAAGTSLGAGKAVVVFGAASGIPGGLTNAVAASTGSLGLGNSGDTVTLKNGTTVIDQFTYSSALSGTDGVSMNRSPDATAGASFVLHTALSSSASSPGKRPNGTAY